MVVTSEALENYKMCFKKLRCRKDRAGFMTTLGQGLLIHFSDV